MSVAACSADAYAGLRAALTRLGGIPEAHWPRIERIFRPRRVSGGAYLALPGRTIESVWFLHRGLVRLFYLTPEGKAWNKGFIAEGGFAGSLAALSGPDESAPYGIQALEPVEALGARTEDFRALYDLDPAFERIGRRLAERVLARKALRERSFLQENATGRYLAFRDEFPELEGRLPQYHIASYLGITEVSLSRIRRALADSAG